MPKEDCKYWEKCYQRNEAHLEKYNHPPKDGEDAPQVSTSQSERGKEKEAPKRKTPTPNTSVVVEGTPTLDTSVVTEGSSKSPNNKDTSEMPAVAEGSSKSPNNTSSKERKEYDTNDLRTEALGNIAGKNYMEILAKRIKFSVKAEYEELLSSNEFIRHKFLVEMPPDFYVFWKFACSLKKDSTGEQVLQYFEKTLQLQLVGPFEFLAERFHKAKIREPGDYLRHWRFYYDPPEFQTIFVRRDTGIHYGYWRDVPQEHDCLLIARNDSTKDYKFEFIAGNAFDAFLYYLEHDYKSTPFTAAAVANMRKALQAYITENEVKLEKLETLRKRRSAKVVAKTLHEAGIVVPLEEKTQLGYRPLIVSDRELKKILDLFNKAEGAADNTAGAPENIKAIVLEKLQPIATAANIAMDEFDFGTALELGIDLLCSGRRELHSLAQSLLVPAYSLLSRPQFIAISKAHMEQRDKTLKLSIFELDKE